MLLYMHYLQGQLIWGLHNIWCILDPFRTYCMGKQWPFFTVHPLVPSKVHKQQQYEEIVTVG